MFARALEFFALLAVWCSLAVIVWTLLCIPCRRYGSRTRFVKPGSILRRGTTGNQGG